MVADVWGPGLILDKVARWDCQRCKRLAVSLTYSIGFRSGICFDCTVRLEKDSERYWLKIPKERAGKR